ncbi:MAG: hypothetical protein JWP72_3226, partial [Massilia sp.]|nr:hypothetical protein [Massilia sp.]
SVRAAAALDEAWALLARLERADDAALAGLLDEADRIVANLEHEMAGRKRVAPEREDEGGDVRENEGVDLGEPA